MRAAEVEANDAWTWIIVAILANDNGTVDRALANAQRSAAAKGDWRALVFAKQWLGLTLESRGRTADADQAMAESVLIALQRGATNLTDVGTMRELARDLMWFGSVKARRADPGRARALFENALKLRRVMAASQPDGMRETVELIASLLRLHALLDQFGQEDEAAPYRAEASRLYYATAERSPFSATSPALSGLVTAVLLMAGGLTLIAGLLLLAAYRRRMRALMRAAATAPMARTIDAADGPPPSDATLGDMPVRLQQAATPPTTPVEHGGPIAQAGIALRKVSWVYAMSGCAFAAVATGLTFHLTDLEFSFVKCVLIMLAWAWPLVLVLNLVWGQDRRPLGVLLLAYFGILFVVCLRVAFSDTPPLAVSGYSVAPFFDPLIFWATTVLPTLFLLVFLLRSIRAIGPVLLVFMLVISSGGAGGAFILSMHAVMRAVASIMPTTSLSSAGIALLLSHLAGMVLFAPLAWVAINVMRRRYEAKRFSDATMVFDSIWLFQTLSLFAMLFHSAGYAAWVAIGAFALYKAVAWSGLRLVAAAAAQRSPARLLLLRVFGFKRRTERLFDRLAARWRHAGPIALIAAPDVASRSIDPAKFLDFVSGRLRRRFIIEPSELEQRFHVLDNRPDPDARYRIDELFCGKDTWQAAVRLLMGNCDLVAMDLRGFSPKNKGCVFELQSLVDHVPLGKVVLLTDATTDVPFLRQTLTACWRAARSTSARAEKAESLVILETGGHDLLAVDALMSIADEMLAKPASSPEHVVAPTSLQPA